LVTRGAAHAAAVPSRHARVEIGVADVDTAVDENDEEGAVEGDAHDRREFQFLVDSAA